MATVDSSRTEWQKYSTRERLVRYAGMVGLLAILVGFWLGLDIDFYVIESAPVALQDLFTRMWPPDVAYAPSTVGPLLETVHMAVIGTILSIVISIPVAVIAAENLTPNWATYWLGKFIVSATRSLDNIIWALILILLVGPGALAGLLALALHSLGFIAKFFAEEIEEIDRGEVEAIRATGANRTQIVLYGIVPQIKAAFTGLSVYRWDVNVRSATVLGLVGAGGIGVFLKEKMSYLYWDDVLTILIGIFVLVVISEAVSAYARRIVR